MILNRLKEGMPLQIDATLCYAKGGCPPVPTDADRKIDSPYNTYKIERPPPDTDQDVSAVALRAALEPAPVAFKYYVSDANGQDLLRGHPLGAREERRQGARVATDAVRPARLATRGRVGHRAARRADPKGR